MTAKGFQPCRFCGGPLAAFVDLGMSPLCESYLPQDQLNSMEPFYPLVAYVCRDCLLVQLQEYVAPEHIFRNTLISQPIRMPGSITLGDMSR